MPDRRPKLPPRMIPDEAWADRRNHPQPGDAERLRDCEIERAYESRADVMRLQHALDTAQSALAESRAEVARLNSVLSMFREMADAAEAEYWAYNRAHLDIQPSRERVFDALRLLGRYPPPGENIIGPADGAEQEHRREGAA